MIKLHEGVDSQRWLEVARACPSATFFHTPYWIEIAQVKGEWEDATVSAELEDGAQIVFPLLRRKRRPASLAPVISTWAGCYGGPIADRPLTDAEDRALERAVRRHVRGDLTIVTNPFGPRFPHRGTSVEQDVTHIVDLSEGFETVARGYAKGHRHAVNRARREGLVTREVDPATETDAYFSMYEDNLARWEGGASSRYPREVFDAMAQLHAEAPGTVRLWQAYVNDELECGTWFFYWQTRVIAWHGASYAPKNRKIRPWTAFLTDVIRDATERGLQTFDFNPSGGHSGTADFKRRFGAHELPVARLKRSRRVASGINKVVDRAHAVLR